MTTPSAPLDDSSKQTRTGASAEEPGNAAPSALPPYMVTPKTLPAGTPPAEAPEARQEEQPTPASAPSSLGAAVAAAQTESVIAVAPDGTAVVPDLEAEALLPPEGEDVASPDSATGWYTASDAPADGTAPAPDKFFTETAGAFASKETLAAPKKEKTVREKAAAPARGPAPKYPPFAQTHPLLGVEQTMPPSLLSRLYAIPAVSPFFFLTLMLLLQVFLCLGSRDLWIGGEVQLAGMFQSFLSGDGLLMSLNGQVQPGTPPLYFWFLYGLSLLIRTQGPVLFFLAAAISALLYLWAALGLGRLAGRVDKRTNLAAGIMLLSAVCILGVTHTAGKELLFAALTLCSCTALYRAFVSPKAETFAMIRAFILAAVATLVSGPLGLLIPVCAIVLFAVWRGAGVQLQAIATALAALAFGLLPALAGLPLFRLVGLRPDAPTLPLEWGLAILALPAIALLLLMKVLPRLRAAAAASLALMAGAFILSGGTPYFGLPPQLVLPLALLALPVFLQATPQRLFRRDFFIGLGAGVLLIALWLAAVYWVRGDRDFILEGMLKKHLLDSAVQGLQDLPGNWHYYLVRLPLAVLPWTLLILFLPWKRLFGKSMREGLAASRTPAKEGLAFLWCLILAGLALITLSPEKSPYQLLPVFPALAVLAARVLLGIEGKRAAWFRYTLAVLIFVSAVATLLGTLMLFGALPKPDWAGIPWVLPSSGGFFAVGVLLMLTGVVLWLVLGSSRPEGVLLVMAACATLVGYSLGGLSAPALDPVLSPKQQSLLLRAYADKGYTSASYNVDASVYGYYTRRTIPALADLEAAKALIEKGDAVIAMPLADAEAWADKPECVQEVQRQSLGKQAYVLLACPAIPGLAPAEDPFKGGFDLVEEGKTLLRDFGLLAPATEQPAQPAEEKELAPAPQQPAEQQQGSKPAAQQPAEPEAAPEQRVTPEQTPAQPEPPAEPSSPAKQEPAPSQQDSPSMPEPREPSQPAPQAPGEAAPDAGHPAAPQENAPEPAAPGEAAPESAPVPQGRETLPPAVPQDHTPPVEIQEPAPETLAPSTAGVR